MRTLTIMMALLIAGPSWTQKLRSIEETMAGNEDSLHVSAYTAVRCAGLFDVILVYSGDNISDEMRSTFQGAIGELMTGATAIRMAQAQERGMGSTDVDLLLDQAGSEILGFSNIYAERFRSNYNFSGAMFDKDALALADLSLCNKVVPKIRSLKARIP